MTQPTEKQISFIKSMADRIARRQPIAAPKTKRERDFNAVLSSVQARAARITSTIDSLTVKGASNAIGQLQHDIRYIGA